MPSTAITNNGIDIPRVGYPGRQIVRIALDAGYRHIDTAQVYGNEAKA